MNNSDVGNLNREQQIGKVLLEYMRLQHERGKIDLQTEKDLIAKFPEEDRKHGRELLLTAELLMIVDPEKLGDEDGDEENQEDETEVHGTRRITV
jgi:hypothetical protein